MVLGLSLYHKFVLEIHKCNLGICLLGYVKILLKEKSNPFINVTFNVERLKLLTNYGFVVFVIKHNLLVGLFQ